MRRPVAAGRLILAAVLVAGAAGACAMGLRTPPPTGTPAPVQSIVPVVASPVLAVGENRLLYSVLDAGTNQPAARPDRISTIGLLPPGSAAGVPGAVAEAAFLWVVDDISGLYAAQVTFDQPGSWTGLVRVEGAGVTAPEAAMSVTVAARRGGVSVGDPAPRFRNQTLVDVGGDPRLLSTDVEPDPAFYRDAIPDLLDAGRPFVLLLGSPGFCTSGMCSPTIVRLRAAAEAHPGIAFVHVEAYAEHVVDGRLQPTLDDRGNLQPSAGFLAWGLPNETGVVVVDGRGTIRAIFDLVLGAGEVEVALAELDADA